jgi:RHS repeat-associated protein
VSGNPETWDAKSGSFTYDANGNLKTAPAPYSITASTYDHRNLPISITAGGVTSVYRYNHEGQRIAKQAGAGNTEFYVLEGAATLGVFTVNGSGTPTSWYFNLLAGQRVIGRQPNTGDRLYYHRDLLGSTRAVVDSATVVESYDYDPWGLLMPGRTLAGGTKERFTGKERDAETGLDYFGFRYYMPAVGRWTTVDPPADEFPSWSPYNYVQNNPVSYTDPYGLCPDPPGSCQALGVSVGSGIGATVGGIVALGCTVGSGGVCSLGAPALVGFFATGGAAVGGLAGTIVEMASGSKRKNAGNSGRNAPGQTAGGRATDEHGNVLGPSGEPAIHQVDHSTRKRAKDAARNEGQGAPVQHPSPQRGEPHFHPADRDGNKKPGSTHHNYPRR